MSDGAQTQPTPDAHDCEQSEAPGEAAERIAARRGITFAEAMEIVRAWEAANDATPGENQCRL